MTNFTISDLIAWASERLPGWQRQALHDLLQDAFLDENAITRLADLAKAADAPATPLTPPPSAPAASSSPLPLVRLTALENIQNVNALASGPIPFADTGLTVIYGGNACGKSGIARILKKACYARAPGGPILPNVFDAAPADPASATIRFRVDSGSEQTQPWVDGSQQHADLRSVHVFDSECAAHQIREANRISYTPDILQLFRVLAHTIDRVADRIRADIRALGSPPALLSNLALSTQTEAGKLVASLSADTDTARIDAICVWGDTERDRVAALNRALEDDPAQRAERDEARATQLRQLWDRARSASALLDDANAATFSQRLQERAAARSEAEAAREAFAENSDLSGIGSNEWRSLWEAARAYSERLAYPGRPFPVLADDSLCVLCQQPLHDGAIHRLESFEAFVKAEAQQRARKAEDELRAAVERIRQLDLPRSAAHALRLGGALTAELGRSLRDWLVRAKLRRRHLLRLLGGDAKAAPPLPPVPDITPLLDEIAADAARLRAACNADERSVMERERAELRAREQLAPHAATVRGEVARLRQHKRLTAALESAKTQPITRKAGEVARLVISDRLRNSFQTNLRDLGFHGSPVDVRLGAGEFGEHPWELQLVADADIRPTQILSEGERTCVALAGLLAELEVTGNRSALVLDDPVSSLDHQYRKRVAERLVGEAKARQVIVLTHDVAFLFLLRKYSKELTVDVYEDSIERGHRGQHARPIGRPPWFAMTVNQCISQIRNDLTEARRFLNQGDRAEYNRRASQVYKGLRMAWERAVEEVLLHQTVVRFGDSVQTRRLAKLTDIGDEDVTLVTREMSRCSDYEHDESGAVASDPPNPDTVEADIAKLANWVGDLRRTRGRG